MTTDNLSWHSLDIKSVFDAVASSVDGLSENEADIRRQKFGLNRLKPVEKKSAILRFAAQFHNVLIYVLLLASVVTFLLGHWVDSSVILGVVIINAIIGFIQEGKAEKALDAIRNLLSRKAMVKRNGIFISIDADDLVPGDIIVLQSGDKVPADIRLYQSRSLSIDEALLTGESMPAEKNTDFVEENTVIGDRTCMAYSGTLVTYGQGYGVVVNTGEKTEIGRISGLLREVQQLTTPLLRQMAEFAKWLTIAIAVIATLTFIYGIWIQNYAASEMFLAAVGLAVAGIPEGLPAIMTITLAIGVQKMAGKNAIIRRLPAVETLGSISVICSDKTGTLTRNEMTAQSISTCLGNYEVSGSGYDPHGTFSQDGNVVSIDDSSIIRELTKASILCNDARLVNKNDQWTVEGDPTEGALLSLAKKAGLEQSNIIEQYPRLDVIPFESEHRYMATLHHDHTGNYFIYVKGAPEKIIEMCLYQRSTEINLPLDNQFWEHTQHDMASRGQRLLAIAYKQLSSPQHDLSFNDVNHGLVLVGLIGIIDPPREEAIEAVKRCQSAGIRIKMITGDHAVTAMAVGAQLGIGDGKSSVTGLQLETLDDNKIHQVVNNIDIFARVSPEQKLQIVTAIQSEGGVVSMTGDGVNDAPALKRADVGIAMGMKGTEVAKEAAEMVLADDNFATIAHAVEEGRTVYDNLKKSILFILPTNGGEAFIIISAIILGRMLPITPAQILWINMITAVTLALTLAFEPSEQNVMTRKPRNPGEPLLSGFLIWRIVFVSLILVVGTFGLFIWERNNGASIEYGRTVAVNTLVMFEIFYLFSSRFLLQSSLSFNSLTGNRYVFPAIGILVFMQLILTYFEPMQRLFATTDIELLAWIKIVLVATSVFILVETEKYFMRRYFRHSGDQP